jgi:hypothetical protein
MLHLANALENLTLMKVLEILPTKLPWLSIVDLQPKVGLKKSGTFASEDPTNPNREVLPKIIELE